MEMKQRRKDEDGAMGEQEERSREREQGNVKKK